jgi:proteasome lid subunit RPN8/RPN11
MIRTAREHLDAIKRHGEETYPHECCGFLLGASIGGANVLREVYRARNEWVESDGTSAESKKNRYLISPEQWREADGYARRQGLGIVGYYHSHPDHPARPSGYDLDHSCWPGESYIIVSVEQGKATLLNSFTKPDYSKFEPEEIVVED